jgi:hypothetical protein
VLIRRRFSLLVALSAFVAAGLGWAPATRAADPVVTDATVSVAFTQAAPGADLAGPALAGAAVELIARLDGSDPAAAPLQVLYATTGPTGMVALTGVARSSDPSLPVRLSIAASATTTAPSGPCVIKTTWSATQDGIVSAAAVAVDLVGHATISTTCPPGTPAPAGVVLDGEVVVTVTGGSGIPLPDVIVSLTASTGDAPFQAFDGLTDDDGRAIFSGVGRSDGGPVVTLAATAARTTHELVDGCTFTQHWSGAARDAGAAGTVDLPVTVGLATTVACSAPAADAPLLTGFVLDAAGGPVGLVSAWVAMERADGGRWVGPIGQSAGGGFAVRVQPWGTDDEPARLEVRVIGASTGQRSVGDCTYTDGHLGSLALDVALAEGLDPDPVTITTTVGQQGALCGAVATPGPGSSAPSTGVAPPVGPTITLPPTDAGAAIRGDTGAPLLPALIVALGLAALLLGWELIRRDA